jgi:hypothetical protein
VPFVLSILLSIRIGRETYERQIRAVGKQDEKGRETRDPDNINMIRYEGESGNIVRPEDAVDDE